MIMQRVSPVTGQTNQWDLDITVEQLDDWDNGTPIQDAMPHLSANEREFLITGCTPDDWDHIFRGPME
jgi:hypothetical protein